MFEVLNKTTTKKTTIMTLVERLTAETQELKKTYIEMTIEWAKEDFARTKQWISEAYKKQREELGSSEYWAIERKIMRLPSYFFNGDANDHVEKMVKAAQKHYTNSIAKLALRIEKKGLNQDKIEMTTGYVDVNITTTITDGEKVVRAWTIIASGDIQKPHYRYLVK